MKIITLLIGLFMTTISLSQSFDKVEKAIFYTYKYGDWVTEKTTYPEGMFVIMNGYEIKITNQNESKFITYGIPKKENTSEYESNTWDAYDKDGDRCLFVMTKYYNTDGYSIFIMYNKMALQYIISKK